MLALTAQALIFGSVLAHNHAHDHGHDHTHDHGHDDDILREFGMPRKNELAMSLAPGQWTRQRFCGTGGAIKTLKYDRARGLAKAQKKCAKKCERNDECYYATLQYSINSSTGKPYKCTLRSAVCGANVKESSAAHWEIYTKSSVMVKPTDAPTEPCSGIFCDVCPDGMVEDLEGDCCACKPDDAVGDMSTMPAPTPSTQNDLAMTLTVGEWNQQRFCGTVGFIETIRYDRARGVPQAQSLCAAECERNADCHYATFSYSLHSVTAQQYSCSLRTAECGGNIQEAHSSHLEVYVKKSMDDMDTMPAPVPSTQNELAMSLNVGEWNQQRVCGTVGFIKTLPYDRSRGVPQAQSLCAAECERNADCKYATFSYSLHSFTSAPYSCTLRTAECGGNIQEAHLSHLEVYVKKAVDDMDTMPTPTPSTQNELAMSLNVGEWNQQRSCGTVGFIKTVSYDRARGVPRAQSLCAAECERNADCKYATFSYSLHSFTAGPYSCTMRTAECGGNIQEAHSTHLEIYVKKAMDDMDTMPAPTPSTQNDLAMSLNVGEWNSHRSCGTVGFIKTLSYDRARGVPQAQSLCAAECERNADCKYATFSYNLHSFTSAPYSCTMRTAECGANVKEARGQFEVYVKMAADDMDTMPAPVPSTQNELAMSLTVGEWNHERFCGTVGEIETLSYDRARGVPEAQSLCAAACESNADCKFATFSFSFHSFQSAPYRCTMRTAECGGNIQKARGFSSEVYVKGN